MKNAPGAFPTWKQLRRMGCRKVPFLEAFMSIVPNSKSVVDLGAALGTYVIQLRENGYQADGVDGTADIEKWSDGLIKYMDLTQDCYEIRNKYDWAIFSEVGEHVPRSLECKLFDEVCSIPKEGLFITWADGINPGFRHINVQQPDYVLTEVTKRDWKYNSDLTEVARKHINRRAR